MSSKKTAIFYFRRDLRYGDNIGLGRALEENDRVVPVFIFDPRQLKPHEYRSEPGLHFMLKALQRLQQKLQDLGSCLLIKSGTPHEGLLALCREYSATSIYFNRDYTPFSQRRDSQVIDMAQQHGINIYQFNDSLLNPPEICLKKDGQPYTIFTPFYKNARYLPVMPAQRSPHYQRLIPRSELPDTETLLKRIKEQFTLPTLLHQPTDMTQIFSDLSSLHDYEITRNKLAMRGTSHLAAFLKFGIISVRDVFHRIKTELGTDHPLTRQLYWREFYSHIAYHFPSVFGSEFKPQYADVVWKDAPQDFEAWCSGNTGFPVVDAGMRELNSTGFMHNRARMITASFLVKDLHIDWRQGERYFAQKLMDYDPAVNNGNWQWAASTGCDAQPYFRIFNPWLQQKRFDPECLYIKRWIPELRAFTPQQIHNHVKAPLAAYPNPIVDHGVASTRAKRMFQEAAQEFQRRAQS